MPVAHTPVPMLYGCGHLGRELWSVALSQSIHETMTFRYVLWPDRAACAVRMALVLRGPAIPP
jgi:hypothetical protein